MVIELIIDLFKKFDYNSLSKKFFDKYSETYGELLHNMSFDAYLRYDQKIINTVKTIGLDVASSQYSKIILVEIDILIKPYYKIIVDKWNREQIIIDCDKICNRIDIISKKIYISPDNKIKYIDKLLLMLESHENGDMIKYITN